MTDTFDDAFDQALEQLERDRILPRIWQRDHTVWRPDPTEIADRLGWLDAPATMARQVADLHRHAAEARDAGVRDVVLLGMGGSSLGAEALARCLDLAPGMPRLHVLDSTVPDWVRRVRAAVDPAQALFVVASKSGTTAEVQALCDYFWAETAVEVHEPGERFAAVTDPGTPLEQLARELDFRFLLLNPADIGGRFSVLSCFGLFPAALAGADIGLLLDRALAAAGDCGPEIAAANNPAARLAAFLAAGARLGRPKLTLLTPPRLAAFGLWAEQLLAESTGKDGTGILPVVGEPWVGADAYGGDRIFVALRLGDGDREAAARLAALREARQPLFELRLEDSYGLGRELFVWQLATAVAGHLLGVHPFDQPDVQAAKDRTKALLARYESEGALPRIEAPLDLPAELAGGRPEYVALLAYLDAGEELEAAVTEMRAALLRRGIPSTFGYGPRYLHSTGQLHKGGIAGGVHVLLLPARQEDLPLPGRGYGFATLAAAQAAGDLLALQGAGRRCLRLELQRPAAELRSLAARL
ncbi:MAG TPA: glucose-6-phosphate isomerase [Thermoanaerobaculia bacterium]|nr:glucose-6-phosphate isomerase [Thermoanaerobaculia bacterium]